MVSADRALASPGWIPNTMTNTGTADAPVIAASIDPAKFFLFGPQGAALIGWDNLTKLVNTQTAAHSWIWLGHDSAYNYANCSNIAALKTAYPSAQNALKVSRDVTGACAVLETIPLYTADHVHKLNVRIIALGIPTTGAGTVTVSPADVGGKTSCGGTAGISCFFDYNISPTSGMDELTLTANPATTAIEFAGWGGECPVGMCVIDPATKQMKISFMGGDQLVYAFFKQPAPALSSKFFLIAQKTGHFLTVKNSIVTDSSLELGQLSSTQLSVLKFKCGGSTGLDCFEIYNSGTNMTLYAYPASNAVFSGWDTSTCSVADAADTSCDVAVNGHTTAIANFGIKKYTLSVTKDGAGSGTIAGMGTGINCGATCSNSNPMAGFGYLLTAAPGVGSTFAGWTGCDAAVGNMCVFTMAGNRTVNATFNATIRALNVSVVGGSGIITSNPAGISCSSGSCSASYIHGTNVTLTASSDRSFGGWGGDCASRGTNLTCTLAMTADKSVTANFPYRLNVNIASEGGAKGAVWGGTPAIQCDFPAGYIYGSAAICSRDYSPSTGITLTAVPGMLISSNQLNAAFAGWTGCTASATDPKKCVFSMDSDKTITARFTPKTQTLTITSQLLMGNVNAASSGTITGPGINCNISGGSVSGDCSEPYFQGTSITLQSTDGPNSRVNYWGNTACYQTPSCGFTIGTADVSAHIVFAPYYRLKVNAAVGTGIGRVTSQPSFIDCGSYSGIGSACDYGQWWNSTNVLTLSAAPFSGSIFTGWSGGTCGGVAPCVLNMKSDASVVANFEFPNPTLLKLSRLGPGPTTIISSDSFLNCSIGAATTTGTGACSRYYGDKTSVSLTTSVDANQARFVDWSGCDTLDTSTNPPICAVNFSCPEPTEAAAPMLVDDGSIWTQATAAAQWPARLGHSSVVFDGKMWVLGGAIGYQQSTYAWTSKESNDIWYSKNGVNWTKAASSAPWPPRYWHTSLVFDNKMWVLGNGPDMEIVYNYITPSSDMAWSSSDGIDWKLTAVEWPWPINTKKEFASVVFKDRIWVLGGRTSYWWWVKGGGSPYTNDVLYSYDGKTWIMATENAGWTPRIHHSAVVFKDKIWVIGGDVGGSDRAGGVWYSSDGINWNEVKSASASSMTMGRYAHTSVVFDNKIWVIGGRGGGNAVWYSSDGITWNQAAMAASWPARSWHTSLVFDDGSGEKMWVIGGNRSGVSYSVNATLNDVWYSTPH